MVDGQLDVNLPPRTLPGGSIPGGPPGLSVRITGYMREENRAS